MQYAAVSIGVVLSDIVVFSNNCVEVGATEKFGRDERKPTGTVFHIILKAQDLRNQERRFS